MNSAQKEAFDRFVNWADEEYWEFANTSEHIAEPCILSDWNVVPDDIKDALEDVGVQLLQIDEWAVDHKRGTAWRVLPDGAFWQPKVAFTGEGDLLTPEDDPEDWIGWAMNNPDVALLPWFDMTKHGPENGWEQVQPELGSHYSGFYSGMTDDPHKEYEELKDRGDVIFQIKGGNMFCTEWTVWVRPFEEYSDPLTYTWRME